VLEKAPDTTPASLPNILILSCPHDTYLTYVSNVRTEKSTLMHHAVLRELEKAPCRNQTLLACGQKKRLLGLAKSDLLGLQKVTRGFGIALFDYYPHFQSHLKKY
jgi:hypothetical protein